MIWAILALLGVPLWLCALAIGMLIVRNRKLHGRVGNVSVRFRSGPGKRWTRGNAVWIHDVFAFRGFPAAWKETLFWVASADTRTATGENAHKLRRLDRAVIATLTGEGGGPIEVAGSSDQVALMLGPFAQSEVTAQAARRGSA
jgi:hypothetical protein